MPIPYSFRLCKLSLRIQTSLFEFYIIFVKCVLWFKPGPLSVTFYQRRPICSAWSWLSYFVHQLFTHFTALWNRQNKGKSQSITSISKPMLFIFIILTVNYWPGVVTLWRIFQIQQYPNFKLILVDERGIHMLPIFMRECMYELIL